MFLTELIFIIILTVILVGLLVPVGGYTTRHEEMSAGATMVFFFLVLFPIIWAASAWATPYGPAWMGVYWAPILVFGLLFALLIAALSPRRRPGVQREPVAASREAREEAETTAGLFGGIFFIFLIAAVVIAIVSYL